MTHLPRIPQSTALHEDRQIGDQNVGPVMPAVGKKQSVVSLTKLWQVFCWEIEELRPRLLLSRLLLGLLPAYVGNRLRVQVLRMVGFNIGHGTVMWALPILTGNGPIQKRLVVGSLCRFNIGCVLDLSAEITIGDLVGFGHQVMVLTTSHAIGGPERRSAQPIPRSVTIGDGCWLGARCTILPGVTVGSGSIVAAGAVVTKDVPPNTLVAGSPARVVRQLDVSEHEQ